jgi:hypothetical protein
MLTNTTTTSPKTKSELVRTINSLQNPKFDCLDVSNQNDKKMVDRMIGDLLRKGKVGVVLISR